MELVELLGAVPGGPLPGTRTPPRPPLYGSTSSPHVLGTVASGALVHNWRLAEGSRSQQWRQFEEQVQRGSSELPSLPSSDGAPEKPVPESIGPQPQP